VSHNTTLESAIRPGTAEDLTAVEAIQGASPEAAQWNSGDYLQYGFVVAVEQGAVAGFLVTRPVAPGEHEILNLAVARANRRRGLAASLLNAWLADTSGDVFLEVRESNEAARKFYKYMGFQQVSLRQNYYRNPPEAAIVMKFHSC
jgi:ribosomal-protein-alanine N-acetyltransferase